MLTTVEGVFKDGQIKLMEPLPNMKERKVIVTFLPEDDTSVKIGTMIRRGMFADMKELTDDDLRSAEFHGDPDDGLDWN